MLGIDRFNSYTLSKPVRFSYDKSSKRTAHEKRNLINQYLRLHCICSKIYVIYFDQYIVVSENRFSYTQRNREKYIVGTNTILPNSK